MSKQSRPDEAWHNTYKIYLINDQIEYYIDRDIDTQRAYTIATNI